LNFSLHLQVRQLTAKFHLLPESWRDSQSVCDQTITRRQAANKLQIRLSLPVCDKLLGSDSMIAILRLRPSRHLRCNPLGDHRLACPHLDRDSGSSLFCVCNACILTSDCASKKEGYRRTNTSPKQTPWRAALARQAKRASRHLVPLDCRQSKMFVTADHWIGNESAALIKPIH